MPRVPISLQRSARLIDPLLPKLLPPCRTLGAAQNELRWLREHVQQHAKARNEKQQAALLKKLVDDRAKGKPLQYILGTEYFGDLEIRCRPGVLIPRQETAASVTHLARLLRNAQNLPSEFRVLDLCTGTGCIPLLFQHEFAPAHPETKLRLLGVDISQTAVDLAQHNYERVRKAGGYNGTAVPQFLRGDILIDPLAEQTMDPPCLIYVLNQARLPQNWDILISNPPYISPSEYWRTTQRSVRAFEPKVALVPPPAPEMDDVSQGDRFYPRLLDAVRDFGAKIALFEVADMVQAVRVARMCREMGIFQGVEIWRDWPDEAPAEGTETEKDGFPVIGTGNGRSVFAYRGAGAAWLGRAVEEAPVTIRGFRYGAGYMKLGVARDDGEEDRQELKEEMTTFAPESDLPAQQEGTETGTNGQTIVPTQDSRKDSQELWEKYPAHTEMAYTHHGLGCREFEDPITGLMTWHVGHLSPVSKRSRRATLARLLARSNRPTRRPVD